MNLVQPIKDKKKIDEMKERLPPRDSFMFALGINVGCRITDLLELKVKDLRGKDHLTIYESSTGKTKQYPINDDLKELVTQHTKNMNDEDWLFPSRKGDRPISRVQAYRALNKVAGEIGLDEIGTHTLRKSFGYWYYLKTKDIATLQELFNHSAPSVTLRYIGINKEEPKNEIQLTK